MTSFFDTMEIDYTLFKDKCSEFGNNGEMMEVATLYQFYLNLKNEFGDEISKQKFIELLKNTNHDYSFSVKAFLSRFEEITDKDLEKLQKIKK